MNEHPILFSKEMVQAILAGRKTQTRRAVSGKYMNVIDRFIAPSSMSDVWTGYRGPVACWSGKCPYGRPGNTLWVRETWSAPPIWNGTKPSLLDSHVGCWYAADDERPLCEDQLKWRPSIFMPRWASRITLQITDVRIERVLDIAEIDAIAEGMLGEQGKWADPGDPEQRKWRWARGAYCATWERINGEQPWEANPWVWVVSFVPIGITAYSQFKAA